jgi:hypothetical protein
LAIFKKRIPSWGQIAPVYSVIVLMIYSWSTVWFLWKLPSWLFFLNTGEIVIALAYQLATNLVESAVILCAPLVMSLALPKEWFHDRFVARGAALVITGLAYMMYLANQFKTKDDYPSLTLKPWTLVLAIVIILFIVYLAGRLNLFRKVIEVVSDHAIIFLYISLPLSVISLVVVIFRWVV